MKDRISFSEWKLWRNGCQWRWKLDYLDGLRKNDKGIYLDFGTSIHEAIEKFKTRKDPVSLAEAQKIFEETFRKLHSENSEKYKERERGLSLDEFVLAGNRILEHLDRNKELADSEIVFNEHELILPIERTDDVKINFKGFIDLVIKTKNKRGKTILYVIDFKTCSWGWDFDKRTDVELHHQLFLYKHFLCKKFDINPTEVRVAFLLLKRSPRKDSDAVEFFPVSAGPISIQRTLDALNSDITDMKQRLEKNDIVKNRKKCIDDFGGVCPHYKTEHCPDE